MHCYRSDTTAAESALNWLETHGITMISTSENPSISSSSLAETGTTLTLTGIKLIMLLLVNFIEWVHQLQIHSTEDFLRGIAEAGKLALNLVKGDPSEEGIVEEREIETNEQEVTSETVLDGTTIDGTEIQQVITDADTGVKHLFIFT